MKMKFKSTTLAPRISVYKRFIGIEQSMSLQTLYKTVADNLYWAFNNETKEFYNIEQELVPDGVTTISVDGTKILTYMGTYYSYVYDSATQTYSWSSTTTPPQLLTDNNTISVKSNNIGKYQINKYYFVGTIDCMQKGSLEETTTQYLKGNIMPLVSGNIKFFNDYIKVSTDDLIVWHGRLYSVERVEQDHKHQPKDYTVYFATLNSIL